MSEEEKDIIKDFLGLREIYSNNSISVSYLSIYQNAVKKMLNLIDKQQEEIDTWEETESDYEHELARKDEKIEKQQEEIEKLKQEMEERLIGREEITKYEMGYEIENNYISKDKIRQKIREFEQIRNIIANEENQNLNYDMKRNDYCVEMLKDLLEER